MLVHRDFSMRHPRKAVSFILIAVLMTISAMIPEILNAGDKIQKYDHKKGKATIKDLALWAQEGSGDFVNWVTSWKDTSLPTLLRFRWKHNLDKAGFVGWEVYAHGKRIGGPVTVGPLPPKLTNAFFSIPFRDVVGAIDSSTFEVRIAAYTFKPSSKPPGDQLQPKRLALLDPPVIVTIMGGADSQLNFPKLRITFTEIIVLDDSDDLSAGDISFALWAEYSGKKTEYKRHAATVDSGNSTYPNATLTIDEVPLPKTVTLYAAGVDEDGGFAPAPEYISPTEDSDWWDAAIGSTKLNTGVTEKAKTHFFIDATGATDLKLKVIGHYEVSSD